jgi:hypothetical protein
MKHPILSSGFILGTLLLGFSAPALAAETTPPQPVDLLSDANFLVLSGAGIQNLSGAGLTFNGNIGTSPSPGASITGITAAQVNGLIYTVDATGPAGSTIDPSYLTTAKGDMTTAYNDAFGRVLAVVTQAPELGGLTLAPGLYWSATGFTISTGDLTLDAGGDPNGVWIFQAGTAGSPTDVNLLTTNHITMTNSGSANKVFWACRTGIIGTNTSFRGNILAQQSVTNAGNGIFEGRQLAFTGGITFNGVANPSMGIPGFVPAALTPTAKDGSYIYPSPTKGQSADIVYTMVHSGHATIRIHNETGRLVDTIEEDKPQGWQSSKVSVGKFAVGVYFYMLSMKYDDGSKEAQPRHKFVVRH